MAPVCRCFILTVSPREDISENCVNCINHYIQNNCKFFHVVCEPTATTRHLQAMLVFETNQDPSKLRENVWVLCVKPFHPTSIGRNAVIIRVSPARQWIDEYLSDDHSVYVIASHLPCSDEQDPPLEDFLPTPDVQELLTSTKEKTVDVFYASHEAAYKSYLSEKSLPSSFVNAQTYLLYRMNVARDMRVISDSKRVREISLALHRYSMGIVDATAEVESNWNL
jgi:hypothetical protein